MQTFYHVTHAPHRLNCGYFEHSVRYISIVKNQLNVKIFSLQVQQLFPHIPMSVIIDDLRVTRSVELTIENVLDGRLIASSIFRETEVPQPSPSNSVLLMRSNHQGSPRSWEELELDSNGDNT